MIELFKVEEVAPSFLSRPIIFDFEWKGEILDPEFCWMNIYLGETPGGRFVGLSVARPMLICEYGLLVM